MNVLFFAVTFGFVSATLAGPEHEKAKAEANEVINGFASCPGFTGIPAKITKAVDYCSQKSNVAAEACVKTCVYRQLNLFQGDDGPNNATKGIDYGMMDKGSMEILNMDTYEGRKSYYRISQIVRDCGHAYKEHYYHWIAKDYKDAKECEKGSQVINCINNGIKC